MNIYIKQKNQNSIDSPVKCNVIVITREGNIMKDIKEIKTIISSLNTKNKQLTLINIEKDRIINELMDKIEKLENDLEYSKVNGGIKKLVLTRN